MSTLNCCKYCNLQITDADSDFEVYACDHCGEFVHNICTDSTLPSRLQGDNLFVYECRHCTYEKKDLFIRMKLSWVQVIHLTLYNLTITESGRRGYFRWKEDICDFIDKYWIHLMPEREKTATWSSTVAGVLSLHNKLFKSGYHAFHEQGWWALQEVTTPNANPDDYKIYKSTTYIQPSSKKKTEHSLSVEYGRGKRQRKGKGRGDNPINPKFLKLENTKMKYHVNGYDDEKKLKSEDLLGLNVKFEEKINENINDTNDNMVDRAVLVDECLQNAGKKADINSERFHCNTNIKDCNDSKCGVQEQGIPDLFDSIYEHDNPLLYEDMNISSESNPFSLSFSAEDMSNYLPVLFNETSFTALNEFEDENRLDDLFTENETENQPQETVKKYNESVKRVIPLTVKEEMELLNKINESLLVLSADTSVRRLRRKLLIRKEKRETNRKPFCLKDIAEKFSFQTAPNNVKITKNDTEKKYIRDNDSTSLIELSDKSYHHPALRGINVLDRFISFHSNVENDVIQNTVHVRLVGNNEEKICYSSIISPYTSRVLKPYIRRDFQALPLKLKLLREIKQRCLEEKNPCVWPIDYCYVQPSHVPAVNALCSDFFWPGIDMTECLQYPEFSCVVLYRKLMIGFAFMVPDVKYNEAYISFILVHPDWQRAGIGSNMIYHLIQTCMGKDITLHVSPTNPSIMLYQRFGFKSEKLILGFYDRYLPENNKNSNHALLLRLRR